jgi:protoporphyrinogen oxidase
MVVSVSSPSRIEPPAEEGKEHTGVEREPEHTTVVVIGGGIAGLTAACYLARSGAGVTVFEKAPNLGGRAATREYEGFLFNRGGHALYTGGAASRTLKDLGISYDHGVSKDTFVLQGGKISAFPADPLGLLRTDLLDAGDKLALFRFFIAIGRAKPSGLAGTSVQEWLDLKIRPQLRRVMTAFARTFSYTTALDLVSAEMSVEKFQRSLRHPIHYVDGGWQVLIDGLRGAAERAGARIVGDAHVEGVEFVDGRARGVRLRDGGLVWASAVVLATGPRDAAKLVDEGKHPVLRRIADGLVPAPIACLDVALERLPVPEHPVVQTSTAHGLRAPSPSTRVWRPKGGLRDHLQAVGPQDPG